MNKEFSTNINEIRQKLKQVIIQRSYKENHEEMFTLASGKKSPYYFDLKQTLLHPEYLKLAALGLYNLMTKQFEKMPSAIGGLTMGADPLVYSICNLSLESGSIIYPFVVRKQVKDHGSKKRIEGLVGEVPKEAKVVLIDDVITTGNSTIEALRAIEEAGYKPTSAFCIVDRMEGGKENLKKAGVDLYSLLDLNDFSSK
ncbi:MAG: orotate phosphoribosyltransferase [Spirochaetia bacterium]|nr:orotate phosphoribosyltransferase [Spirochaetia bacterium]